MNKLVEMRGVSKEFPGVRALDDVNFTLLAGEVHVLFGENGAGKSTLISLLAGVHRPTQGSIKIAGQIVELRSVHDATRSGVGTVFQEFSLVPTLTVYENIYLGREPTKAGFVDRRAMREGAGKLLTDLDFPIDVRRMVSGLSRAEQQMVEIAKAFLAEAKVLILDEPTASLTDNETRKLFAFIAKAKSEGVGIIYISHRIHEFAEIADQITVLRDGRKICTVPARGTSEKALVELMTGRAIEKIYPKIMRKKGGPVVMSLRNVVADGVKDVSIDVCNGEVLGIAGLVGSGKSRIWRTVFGLQPATAGKIELHGKEISNLPTREVMRRGVFYLPPDRKSEGLHLTATSRENLALSLLHRSDVMNGIGFIDLGKVKAAAHEIAERVEISGAYMNRVVAALSGGNQQKILFGKGFATEKDVYIFDEPTVGVDMGTRAALYVLIKNLAESGKAVVVISSDLPEIMHLSHRLLIFAKGHLVSELTGSAITEQTVLGHFFSQVGQAA